MDGRKKVGSPSSSSSSSFTSELFGSREISSSSSGFFESILAPSSKASGTGSLRPDCWRKPNDSWNDKLAIPGDHSRSRERENPGIADQDSGLYQEQRVSQPCHLSSSIYYGGQDVYSQPKSNTNSSTYKKDVEEDDSGCASRGNWWQGSLYY